MDFNPDYECVNSPDLKEKITGRVLARLRSVCAIFEDLADGGLFDETKVYLNRHILFSTLTCYFVDLSRTKCYHRIDLADVHKQASFVMKWIVKTRPIQIKGHLFSEKMERRTLLANEFLAYHVGMNCLDINIDAIPINVSENILYILRFREIDPMILASQMYLLEQHFKP